MPSPVPTPTHRDRGFRVFESGIGLGKAAYRTNYVVMANADILALRATPFTLVPAVPAGYMLEFVQLVLALNSPVTAYTEATANLAVKFVNGAGVQVSQTIEMTGFIDQIGKMLTNGLPKIDDIATAAQGDGQKLVLHNLGAGEFAAGAAANTLRAAVTYRIWATGF